MPTVSDKPPTSAGGIVFTASCSRGVKIRCIPVQSQYKCGSVERILLYPLPMAPQDADTSATDWRLKPTPRSDFTHLFSIQLVSVSAGVFLGSSLQDLTQRLFFGS